MNLHHESRGEGPALIILHGLFGSLDNWRTMSGKLSRHFRVHAVDLRNHGRSPHSEIIDYGSMAGDLQEFMDAQSIASAFVLGHSLGGKVAMEFALGRPERVEKLVVADIAPGSYPPQHDDIIRSLISLDIGNLSGRAEADAALKKSILDSAVRQFLLKNLVRSDTGELHWRINIRAIAENYGRLIEAVDGGRSFHKPTLFLKGEKSGYIRPGDLADIKRLFPLARLVTIAGAGHWLQADAPSEFYQSVVDFLKPS